MSGQEKTLDCIRKLLNEKGSPEQTYFVMTYLLSKKIEDDIMGYFVILRAFPNANLAQNYVSEVIERTGIRSLIAVPACSLMPISNKSLGKRIPIHVNKEGKLIQISDQLDKQDLEEQEEAQKIKDLISQDQQDLNDPDSIPSLARSWFLLAKYRKQKEYYEKQLQAANMVINNNERIVNEKPHLIDQILEFLEDRLIRFNENELLIIIKQEIENYRKLRAAKEEVTKEKTENG